MGKLVGIAEFKANCLKLIAEMQQDGEPIIITKRGRPVAELMPPQNSARAERLLAAVQGTVTLSASIDPAESMFDPDWEAKWDAGWDSLGFTPREGA